MTKTATILAIESSCDETAVAILRFERNQVKVLVNLISSQVATHAKYGGVVPEVAARLHIQHILPLVETALKEAGIRSDELSAIAVTGGPGLITSLLVGVETAKTLSFAWNIPLIKVNHIEGHIYSSLINEKISSLETLFPAMALVVSGGHTDLLSMAGHGQYKFIGGTRDDAVGEAFDKVAKMLGLGYPGGPKVSARAAEVDRRNLRYKLKLPRPMLNTDDFEMSFSGIKTSVLYTMKKFPKVDKQLINEMCYEFQEAVTEVIVTKTIKAVKEFKVKSVIVGGGVAANKRLRDRLIESLEIKCPGVEVMLPEFALSGDNAVMIGLAGYFHYLKKDYCAIEGFRPNPNWELI